MEARIKFFIKKDADSSHQIVEIRILDILPTASKFQIRDFSVEKWSKTKSLQGLQNTLPKHQGAPRSVSE